MKCFWCLPALLALTSLAGAQVPPSENPPPSFSELQCEPGPSVAGNTKFPNFIGYLSNPLQNIDPRSLTAIYPIFGSSWFTTSPALPDGNLQLYGPALTVALSDRLALGMNQGGYAGAYFERNRPGTFRDRFGRLRNRRDFDGEREGWLNMGGFVQYTFIEDVPNQFLATGGMRIIVPSGSKDVFQGRGPPYLAPYVTVGKEFGCWHVLSTLGYQFPAGPGESSYQFIYANLHIDRQVMEWLYPVFELNLVHHTSSTDVDLPIRSGFIDFGSFSSTGNVLAMAVGANVVLIRERVEMGAVYTRSLATQKNFDFDGMIVKMMFRF